MEEEYTTRRLTEADKNKLKENLRLGYAFLALGLAVGGIPFLILLIKGNFGPALYITAGVAVIGWIVCHIVNKDTNADLRNDVKHVYIRNIDSLGTFSQDLSANWLSHIGDRGKRISDYKMGYNVQSGRMTYPCTKEAYDKLQGQSQCEAHYAPKSFTMLGAFPIDK